MGNEYLVHLRCQNTETDRAWKVARRDGDVVIRIPELGFRHKEDGLPDRRAPRQMRPVDAEPRLFIDKEKACERRGGRFVSQPASPKMMGNMLFVDETCFDDLIRLLFNSKSCILSAMHKNALRKIRNVYSDNKTFGRHREIILDNLNSDMGIMVSLKLNLFKNILSYFLDLG